LFLLVGGTCEVVVNASVGLINAVFRPHSSERPAKAKVLWLARAEMLGFCRLSKYIVTFEQRVGFV
jgi:hypothetical protein